MRRTAWRGNRADAAATPGWLLAPGLGPDTCGEHVPHAADTRPGSAPPAGPAPTWPAAATAPAAPWPAMPDDTSGTAGPAPVRRLHAGRRLDTGDGAALWLPSTRVHIVEEPIGGAPPAGAGLPPRIGPATTERAEAAGAPAPVPPAVLPALRTAPAGVAQLERSISSLQPLADGEAAAFAARFAADYLCFDEDDPRRRAEVLRGYLSDPSAATLGWSGRGRQRADLVLPGRILRTAAGAVIVEVTARVVPYVRTHSPAPVEADHQAGDEAAVSPPAIGPATAPAPSAAGWAAGPAHWVRIAPPVRRGPDGAPMIDIAPEPGPAPDQRRPSGKDPSA